MQRPPGLVLLVCATLGCGARSRLDLVGGDAGVGVQAAPSKGSAAPAPKEVTTRFAVIGDYGNASSEEQEVADLVRGFEPNFVITTGDNNYPAGGADTIDDNIGQYFARFI